MDEACIKKVNPNVRRQEIWQRHDNQDGHEHTIGMTNGEVETDVSNPISNNTITHNNQHTSTITLIKA